jgi:subtilase family serine protease
MPIPTSRFPRGTGAVTGIRTPRAKARVSRIARLAVPVAAVTGLLAFQSAGVTVAATGRPAARAGAYAAVAVPDLSRPISIAKQFPGPISTTDCLAQLGISCYTPLQYYRAYDLKPLYKQGVTGRGRTIVIVDSFGSPTIARDIKTFDAQFGLPDPDLQIEQFGTIPPFDPTNGTMVDWALETTLDVEYAHAIAPGAKIVLAETPVAETEGTVGFPEMMNAEQALINRGVGDVISQSFGATENTFPGFDGANTPSLLGLRYAFKDALRHHVTVLAASGDEGVTNDKSDLTTLYPYPVNSWPSSDPLVTSVGGSQLSLDNNGSRLAPDTVWNDGFGAGGGGFSQVFSRPFFQVGVRRVVGDRRGTPDISMSAAVDGAAWIYLTFGGEGGTGWFLVGGTSEASPIFSGIVALADQAAGHRLGLINPALYLLGALSQHTKLPTGLVDITTGNNSFGGVTGYNATTGYDLASGWGTIDAYKFVHALARLG